MLVHTVLHANTRHGELTERSSKKTGTPKTSPKPSGACGTVALEPRHALLGKSDAAVRNTGSTLATSVYALMILEQLGTYTNTSTSGITVLPNRAGGTSSAHNAL